MMFSSNWYVYRVYAPSISKKWKPSQNRSSQTEIGGKMSAVLDLPLHNRSFGELLLEAVDEALSSLGDSPKRGIYFHLKKTFDINKQDIPHKIEEFAKAIEKIFGTGAKLLEIQIMKRLYEKVGIVFKYFPEKNDLVFTEYLSEASYYFERSSGDILLKKKFRKSERKNELGCRKSASCNNDYECVFGQNKQLRKP